MPDFEERELVERAKEDPDAFGALYDRYFPQIYRFAYSRVRDQSLAEDVTSEVFFKALRNIKRYTYSGHPFSSWLYQITLNAVADHCCPATSARRWCSSSVRTRKSRRSPRSWARALARSNSSSIAPSNGFAASCRPNSRLD
ncbi:MAG: sigma-70 family RNA polymerase sigma factor [Chloroflexi bacterium]|nr:MAG: sigma-70 family RNA polymerase sigma factor [Chloroflexota bacterium]